MAMPGSRQALLEAADRLRRLEPGRALGAREIAREARVNHSLLFRHFGSVEGLLEELDPAPLRQLGGVLEATTSPAALVDALVDALIAHRALLAASAARGLERDGAVMELDALRAPLARSLVAVRCARPADASGLAELVLAAVAGMVVLVGGELPPPVEAIRSSALAMIISAEPEDNDD